MELLEVWGRADDGAMIGLVDDMGVDFFPLEVGGAGLTIAAGDILGDSRVSVRWVVENEADVGGVS
jgi:hypothetical protein